MNNVANVVQLTRAANIFDRMADGLVTRVRTAMAVPAQVDVEIEQEFAALREKLDAFFPEFRELFGGLLLRHIGQEHVPVVLAGLSTEPAQRYFRAASKIEEEMQAQMAQLSQSMLAAVQAALLSSDTH